MYFFFITVSVIALVSILAMYFFYYGVCYNIGIDFSNVFFFYYGVCNSIGIDFSNVFFFITVSVIALAIFLQVIIDVDSAIKFMNIFNNLSNIKYCLLLYANIMHTVTMIVYNKIKLLLHYSDIICHIYLFLLLRL